MARLRDFQDLKTAVCNELKIPLSDSVTLARIELDINMVYEQEVIPYRRWQWLLGHTKVVRSAYYGTGTSSVTPQSATITLTPAPASSLGSFAGYFFSTDNFNEVYTVSAHTAGSATLIIDVPYQGPLGTAGAFKLWNDQVLLPSNCREVINAYHQFSREKLQGQGFREFRQTVNDFPKSQGYPKIYNVAEFDSPTNLSSTTRGFLFVCSAANASAGDTYSNNGHTFTIAENMVRGLQFYAACTDNGTPANSGTLTRVTGTGDTTITFTAVGETTVYQADRFRFMRVFPSISTLPVTINIDYEKDFSPLIDSGDEPMMPLEDRIVLLYGALARAWARERNEEAAQRNLQLYQAKLARMAGKIEDGFDKPNLSVDSSWLGAKRGGIGRPGVRGMYKDWGSGSQSYVIPTYLQNTTIAGANVTANITVVNGITIDGRDISVDGATLDTLVAQVTGVLSGVSGPTTVTLADNQSSAVDAFTLAATSPKTRLVLYQLTRGTSNTEIGIGYLVTNGSSTAYFSETDGHLGTLGVTFSATYSGGLAHVQYTTTSTGTAASLTYKLIDVTAAAI